MSKAWAAVPMRLKSTSGRHTWIYLCKEGERVLILLGGSSKYRQDAAWAEYKRRRSRKE